VYKILKLHNSGSITTKENQQKHLSPWLSPENPQFCAIRHESSV